MGLLSTSLSLLGLLGLLSASAPSANGDDPHTDDVIDDASDDDVTGDPHSDDVANDGSCDVTATDDPTPMTPPPPQPPPHPPRSLSQFRQLLVCTMPNSWPLMTFTRYGCYCGFGGWGQPLDDLDRCCQAHDLCYAEAKQLIGSCHPFFRRYDFSCVDHVVSCGVGDACQTHVCECDRVAADCFSRAEYHDEFYAVDTATHCLGDL
ncbi:acidic phospholipase A2 DE-II-like [Lampetra fluviatilis]